MFTYFIVCDVVPTKNNVNKDKVSRGTSYYCVKQNSKESAMNRVRLYASNYDWKITNVKEGPDVVVLDNFIHEKGKDLFIKAQQHGISSIIDGKAIDGIGQEEPIEHKSSYNVDLNQILKKQKSLSNKGRCFHFAADENCLEYINAHSVEEKGQLSKIAYNGHIYALTPNYSIISKNRGVPLYTLMSTRKITTFKGFCKKHDNELFEPIDNYSLEPNLKQVALYAYRSLCREIFVKENSVEMTKFMIKLLPCDEDNEIVKMQKGVLLGSSNGLRNLYRIKCEFDNLLKNEEYDAFRYKFFISNDDPMCAFSSGIFPDYDFSGNKLQDLADLQTDLSIITYCSAQMNQGWGFLFTWLESDNDICSRYISSLVDSSKKIGDYLFRLFLNCENHALSPKWYDGLLENEKELLKSAITTNYDILVPVSNNYLSQGIEGISNWDFHDCKSG